jgi:hypothetical protein
MKTFLGLVSVVVLLAGCSNATLPEAAPEPEVVEEATPAPEPEVVEEEPEPDEYTSSEKLATVDGRWSDRDLYEQRFQQVSERCPNTEEDLLANALYEATVLLDERGITEDSLWSMETLLGAVAPSEAGTFDCREVLALAVILRIEEG